MKKNLLLILLAGVTLTFVSCTKDTSFKTVTDSKLEILQGEIVVVVTDNIVGDQLIPGGYEVSLKEADTGLFKKIDVDESEIGEYISKSNKLVEIQGKLENDNLIPKRIRVLEQPPQDKVDSSAKAPGGGRGGNDGGGGKGASILLVMVSDANSVPNCSAAEIEDDLIGPSGESTKNFFTLTSKGKFTIGSVTSTEVYIPSITCSVTGLHSRINPILSNQGFKTNRYDHIIYVTAPICGYGGQARLDGNIIHNAYCTWNVVNPHEIGHNLGMNHSTSYNTDGSVSGYGDPGCVMATAFSEIVAPHRVEMGWIGKKSTENVTNSGTFTLSPIEVNNPSNSQVLVVDVGMVNFNRPEKYYLSYRAPIGEIDDAISSRVANKLSIHSWSGEKGWVTRYVNAIDVGESLTDSANGIQFTNLGIQNEEMTVDIIFLN
ncbi:MAG: zinc-dependent metalloprotease [Bacteroidia bacterium]|nr:zinc-dependent metalloprotease [Bacteroidia bacterium]